MFQGPAAGASTSRRQVSDIEPEEGDVPILHHVVAPFEPCFAPFPRRRRGPSRDQVIVGDDLCLDETTLDVAVDGTSRLGGLRALANRPGAYLWVARSQESDEIEQSIRRVDKRWERRLFHAGVFEEYRGLFIRQLTKLGLQPRGKRDDLGMLGGGLLAEGVQLGGLLTDLVLPDVGDVEHWLSGEEGEALEELGLLRLEVQRANRLALIQGSGQPGRPVRLLLLPG